MWTVYGIYSRGKLRYVGMTSNLRRRETEHRASKRFAKCAKVQAIALFEKRTDALEEEARLIREMKPKVNQQMKGYECGGKSISYEDARRIWHSFPEVIDDAVLQMMPGWSCYRARRHFGNRERTYCQ